jgi:hypothetical protein
LVEVGVTNEELRSSLKNGSRPAAVAEAIARLKAERWTLYMRLVAPYFSATPRPELVEVWWREALESVARGMALADHAEAMEFMLGCVNGAGGGGS